MTGGGVSAQLKPSTMMINNDLSIANSSYRVFIKYCVFSEFLKIFRTLFSLGVSVCTHTRQVENQRCSRTGRVEKNHKILGKKTIFNVHPVLPIRSA